MKTRSIKSVVALLTAALIVGSSAFAATNPHKNARTEKERAKATAEERAQVRPVHEKSAPAEKPKAEYITGPRENRVEFVR